MPPMLRDIVREILAGQRDMEIIGETQTDDELLDVLATEAADVVVMQLGLETNRGAGPGHQRSQPGASVLGLSADGRSAAIYDVRLRRTTVVELSPEGLRASIRQAFAART
jgi:DNA-binding NarL/FixJ family response regulator